jgi:hypothetical protein
MAYIKKDIENNLENIISNIEIEPFRLILRKYNEKVDFFKVNLKEFEKDEVPRWEVAERGVEEYEGVGEQVAGFFAVGKGSFEGVREVGSVEEEVVVSSEES